ncbi:MAG: hypothetical protein IJU66_09385 [Oscillospiraceae bacterium]|nr:hypothetical protein [Oscillospiraceae bacterium]
MDEMTYNERRKIYERAIEKYGAEAQERMLFEEMAELQNALMKYHRDRDTVDHVAEEIADATIMLEQARLFLDVNDLVKDEMRKKCERLRERLAPRPTPKMPSYRGKTIEGNKWVYGNGAHQTDIGMCYVQYGGQRIHQQVQPDTLGEYIMRTDKKGMDVFTGDVVKITRHGCPDYSGYVSYSKMHTAYVVVTTRSKYGTEVELPLPPDDMDIEVLGNVYDNPELVDA